MTETATWGRKTAWRTAITQRRASAIELRAAGCSWQGIADELGYKTRGAACQDVRRAMVEVDRRQRESAAEARALRVELGSTLLARWLPIVDADIWEMFAARPTEVLDAVNVLSRALDEARH